MSFGFKNARAIYQKLMDWVFKYHIRRNIEVYADDILVKSTRIKDLISDLEETFSASEVMF